MASTIYDTIIDGRPVCRTCTHLVLRIIPCLLPDSCAFVNGYNAPGGSPAYAAGIDAEHRLSYYGVGTALALIITDRHPR